MTQEDKELLLKDLSARLPYGVKIDKALYGETTLNERDIESFRKGFDDILVPYLRPMSSMTEEEKREFYDICTILSTDKNHFIMEGCIDSNYMLEKFNFLNAHHFDYRGLIEMGLAIEAPKGMYNS